MADESTGEGEAVAETTAPATEDVPRDRRVVCVYCAGFGQSKGADCTRCGGTGLVEPSAPVPDTVRTGADNAGEERPPEVDPDQDRSSAPRRRKKREPDPRQTDMGFDVDEEGAARSEPRVERKQRRARAPVAAPRMSEAMAVQLATGLLVAVSTGVSVITDAPVAAPTKLEAERLSAPLAGIVQRYLGTLGEHTELMVFAALLFAYGRARWIEARAAKRLASAPTTPAPKDPT